MKTKINVGSDEKTINEQKISQRICFLVQEFGKIKDLNKVLILITLALAIMVTGCVEEEQNQHNQTVTTQVNESINETLNQTGISGWVPDTGDEQDRQPQSGELSPNIMADLSMSGIPSLDQVVELTFSSKSYIDAKNITMEIFLPEEFALVDGNLTFKGEIPRNKNLQIKALVKPIKTGMWTIKTRVVNYYMEGGNFTNWDYLYVNVSENSGQVSNLPFDYPSPTKKYLEENLDENRKTMPMPLR
jgi:hypothetical protein